MKRSESRLIELYHTLPVHSLRTLLDRNPVERDSNGAPLAGTNEVARAHEVLSVWLKQAQQELGLGRSDEFEQNEIHRAQAMIGTCPECDQNDGVVIVYGKPWVVCHKHFTRWKTDQGFLDYQKRCGFSTVTAAEAGVMRYTEIEYHFAESLAKSWWQNVRWHVELNIEVAWAVLCERVLKPPVRLLRRLVWDTVRRVRA